jgi:hypothetical protein
MSVLISNANRILALLPPKDFERLQAQLGPITLPFSHVLYEPGEPIVLGLLMGLRACSCSCYQIVKQVYRRAQARPSATGRSCAPALR